jgi:DNA-binding NtrC family response regulator
MESKLPQILIVDDMYGDDLLQRRRFCDRMRIRDIEANNADDDKGEYFAEAKFCSGQVRTETHVKNSLELVMQEVEKGWPFEDGSRWALIMIDYHFPSGELAEGGYLRRTQPGDDYFGKTILEEIVKRWPFKPLFQDEPMEAFPEIPCVMFSTRPSGEVEPMVDPIGNRAFIQRPLEWTPKEIVERRKELADILFIHGLVEDGALRIADRKGEPEIVARKQAIVGKSLAVLRTLRNARAALRKSGHDFMLIQGEKGTGKEEIVRYIHDYSGRKSDFVKLDPSTVPVNLVEAEIFGYEKGAFTGAVRSAPSIFEQAKTGTVFLDEIGNLEFSVLQKLLSVTQSGKYRRIGHSVEMNSHCQVVCATNKSVEQRVEQGLFPPDLADRLKSVIYLPPLRSREDDKRNLFDYFVKKAIDKNNWENKVPVPGVYDLVESYSWPGNVREMENMVDKIVSNRRYSGTIQLSDIAVALKPLPRTEDAFCKNFESLLNEIRMFKFQEADSVRGAYPRFTAAASSLVSNIIETAAALSTSIKRDGTLNRTGCIREVFGEGANDFRPTTAKRLFKKLRDDYNLNETSEVLANLIDWAAKPEQDAGSEQ